VSVLKNAERIADALSSRRNVCDSLSIVFVQNVFENNIHYFSVTVVPIYFTNMYEAISCFVPMKYERGGGGVNFKTKEDLYSHTVMRFGPFCCRRVTRIDSSANIRASISFVSLLLLISAAHTDGNVSASQNTETIADALSSRRNLILKSRGV